MPFSAINPNGKWIDNESKNRFKFSCLPVERMQTAAKELLYDVRLHFEIYNQNGNLFDYETTLRLECIKWQLPLFLHSLMR